MILDLPTDSPRRASRVQARRTESFELDAVLVKKIRAAGEVPVVLLAAVAALLARYAGSEDEVEVLACVPMLAPRRTVLCCDVRGRPSLAALVDRVRGAARGAGSSARVMFCTTRCAPHDPEIELACCAIERASTVVVTVEYDASLYARSRIQRLCEHLQILLADGLRHPMRPVGELELLTRPNATSCWAPGRATSVRSTSRPRWSSSSSPRRSGRPTRSRSSTRTLPCATRSCATAVHALAAVLVARGVTRGSLVGVHLHRTLDYPVALLAILRAGGACLPLEPDLSRPCPAVHRRGRPARDVVARGDAAIGEPGSRRLDLAEVARSQPRRGGRRARVPQATPQISCT